MRHPTRFLVIGLLLLLVIASRFLYSSVPEQQHIHELNLVAGSLAQHVPNNIGWKQNQVHDENTNKLQQSRTTLPSIEAGKNAPSMEDLNSSQLKKKEDNLSQKIKEGVESEVKLLKVSGEDKISLKEAQDEKSENDLDRRKIHDKEKLRENKGQHSPFESEASDGEFVKKTALLEEKSLVSDHHMGSERVSKQNDNKGLGTNKNGEKKSEKKAVKPVVSQQEENNILMILAKVSQTSSLAKRFKQCVLSICAKSSIKLTFHIITDTVGKLVCEDTFSQAGKMCKHDLNVTYYDVNNVSKKVKPITKEIQVCGVAWRVSIIIVIIPFSP